MSDKTFFITDEETLRRVVREEVEKALKVKPAELSQAERLTRRQAAKFLDISYQTMYNWTRSGIVKEHGAGKKKFYLRNELMEVIRNG